MKTVKVAGLKITVPGGSAFRCETAPMMPKMHFLCAVVGKRGSGKMVASVNLLEKLEAVDRLIYVSPSAKSNSAGLARLKHMLAPEDMYDNVNDISILSEIVAKIEKERDDLEEYRRKLKQYNSAMKKVSSDMPIFQIDPDMLLAFAEGPPTPHRWGGKPPCICIYFDDILGSQLMIGKGAREMARICLYHRHLGGYTDPKEPGAIGASLLFNVQSWKTSVGGLPKALRNNLTLMLLFKTKSGKELQEIAEEVSGEIDEGTFSHVYGQAMQEPHDFLMIDLHKKANHPSMFRRNFDEFIIPPQKNFSQTVKGKANG